MNNRLGANNTAGRSITGCGWSIQSRCKNTNTNAQIQIQMQIHKYANTQTNNTAGVEHNRVWVEHTEQT